jgi:hypothetical protein
MADKLPRRDTIVERELAEIEALVRALRAAVDRAQQAVAAAASTGRGSEASTIEAWRTTSS